MPRNLYLKYHTCFYSYSCNVIVNLITMPIGYHAGMITEQLYFRQHAAFQLSGWLYDHLRSSWDALISMLPEAAGCLTSAAHVYLVSSSHSDYKAAAGSRLSDWAKSLPAFNLLLWYWLLWVITAVPNQLALTCIYKKLNKKGKKINEINYSDPLALQKIWLVLTSFS